MGLKQAGFEVTGVDIEEQKEYPFSFVQSDVFKIDSSFLKEFDFIWASPPCQAYSIGTKGFRKNGKDYPDLIGRTRKLLLETEVPFVIENVPGAPIRKDLCLIGPMFNLRVIKRRYFEIEGFKVRQPDIPQYAGSVSTGEFVCTSTACVNPGCFGKRRDLQKLYGSKWKENNKIESWQEALGIDWITNRKMLAEAIPPAYAKYIANAFLYC